MLNPLSPSRSKRDSTGLYSFSILRLRPSIIAAIAFEICSSSLGLIPSALTFPDTLISFSKERSASLFIPCNKVLA